MLSNFQLIVALCATPCEWCSNLNFFYFVFNLSKLNLIGFVMIRKVTVEPIVLFYMAAVLCEYTLVQHSFFINACFQVLNSTNENICNNINQTSPYLVSINRKFNHNLSWYNGILSFSSILAALFYGSWSDDISRKFPIIVVILCLSLIHI